MALPPETTAHMLNDLEATLHAPELPSVFRCIFCHSVLAFDYDFIQDLHPFSMTELLFDRGVSGVMFGADYYPVHGVYVGEDPAGTRVDVVSIYCFSCGTWVGWKIIRQYFYHPVIREGQFILAFGGGGVGIERSVFPTYVTSYPFQ